MRDRLLQAGLGIALLLIGLWGVGELIPERPAWEVSVMTWMGDRRTSFADDVMRTVTAFGSPAFTFVSMGLAAVFVLVRLRRPVWFGFLLLSMLAPAVCDRMLKQLVERPRPNISRALDVSGYGFPSGHATSSATVAAALLVLVLAFGPRRARPYVAAAAVIFAFLVGGSRIYIGVHWPTDVLGGFVLGAGWVAICAVALRGASTRDPAT